MSVYACVRAICNNIQTLIPHGLRPCPANACAAAVPHRRDSSSMQVALPVISLTSCGPPRFAFLWQSSNFYSNRPSVPARSLTPCASGCCSPLHNKEHRKCRLCVPVHQCRMLKLSSQIYRASLLLFPRAPQFYRMTRVHPQARPWQPYVATCQSVCL